jgi:hypothetical protein
VWVTIIVKGFTGILGTADLLARTMANSCSLAVIASVFFKGGDEKGILALVRQDHLRQF